jgi:general secretion pathway protein K
MTAGPSRGVALVAVLWALTFLSLAAASFTVTIRSESHVARNLEENARARALADAGIAIGIMAMMDRSPDARWPADGSPHVFRFAGGEVSVSVRDEAGKIDLNRAPDDLLKGLLVVLGLAPEDAAPLVDAIIDYRDPDGLRRLNGAEDPDYARAGLPYGAKDRRFEAVEELQRVLGMNPTLYARMRPFVTVYSGQSGIDPRVARQEVWMSLPGADRESIQGQIADSEDGGDGGSGVGPRDGTLGGSLAARSQGATGIPAAGAATQPGLAGVGRRFIARTRHREYTFRGEAQTASGGVFVREAEARILRIKRNPYRVRAWRDAR